VFYKPITIVNDDSSIVNKLETSLTDDARVVIYDRHVFIVQATGLIFAGKARSQPLEWGHLLLGKLLSPVNNILGWNKRRKAKLQCLSLLYYHFIFWQGWSLPLGLSPVRVYLGKAPNLACIL